MFIKIILLFVVTSLFSSTNAFSLTIVEINTEFLWDDDGENEGRVVTESISTSRYTEELDYYVELIQRNDAQIVGLIEIEGCQVAADLKDRLGEEWKYVCKTGRDNYTGQDVAILTTFGFTGADNFEDYSSLDGDNRVRPSKVVGSTLSDGVEEYFVVVAHLISQRSDNDSRRLHQAKAIVKGVNALKSATTDHVIVMGDFNDYPESPPLVELKSLGLINPATANDCSYTYRRTCRLIDHVLVSEGIAGGNLDDFKMDERFSDHHALIYSTHD